MKQDRFLTGILIGIGVIVVVALTLFFIRKGDFNYTSDSTPEGTMRNYVLALQKRDYEKAYSYLVDGELKPDFRTFDENIRSNYDTYSRSGVTLENTTIKDDTASIMVTIQRRYGGPFEDTYRDHGFVDLVRQDGVWKIKEFPEPFWHYLWYQEEIKY